MLPLIARVLLLAAAIGCILHLVALVRLRHFLSRRIERQNPTPPLTLWRTVKPRQHGAVEKLDALVAASRADDQIVVGVDAGSAELEVCREWRSKHEGRDIVVVPCEPGRAANPKISKFLQMQPFAVHAQWLLTDSEAELTREFVENVRAEWIESGAHALTAGYRFVGIGSALQTMDALPVALTLWPGLMFVRRIDFTLGACTAMRSADVEAIGGWAAVGDQLAEDYHLGQKLCAAGKMVRLSHTMLDLGGDEITAWEYARHQHRLAVTYRAANPLGALGMPLLHVAPLAMLAAVLDPGMASTGLGLFIVRGVTAVCETSAIGMGRGIAWAVAPFVPVMEGLFWVISWLPARVWWAGRWRRIAWRGRFQNLDIGRTESLQKARQFPRVP